MRLIYELPTANLFVGQEPEPSLDDFSDFKWPPYKKVGSYDNFEDDSRLAVRFIDMCPFSRTLCVGGGGGQVLTFSLNLLATDIRLEVCAYWGMGVCISEHLTSLHWSIYPNKLTIRLPFPLPSPLSLSPFFPSPLSPLSLPSPLSLLSLSTVC